MTKIRIALAQINTIVGDLSGNTEKIDLCIKQAKLKKVDIVIFPELTVTGYPPEDLLLKPHFIKENIKYLDSVTPVTKGIIAIVGFADKGKAGIYNAAAVIADGKRVDVYHKVNLPNYAVFDEKRYFKAGKGNVLLKTEDFSFAVNICEDIWVPENPETKRLFRQCQFLINISGSPYYLNKFNERKKILSSKAKEFGIPVIYCNLIGGQDELIFDGRSAVFDGKGMIIAQARAFEEDLLIVDLVIGKTRKAKTATIKNTREIKTVTGPEEVYSALVLGVRDYIKKNGFTKAALGLSGGIDSALVACIASDALGRANVLSISMPSRYSSEGTQEDARKIAKNLGIRFARVPIDEIFDSYSNTLKPHFTGMIPDITEENMQARIRGNILMAFSNKFGYMVLNTGNKSETSVGYCTLYGDMAGGFAVLKDVPKRLVYELSEFVNKREKRQVIPESVLRRAPSAELRAGQKDQDNLPPYDALDKIIDLYIEKDLSSAEILKETKDRNVLKKVLRMIDLNEYKRRQSAPGIKITPRSFGKDRRMPITNKFREFI